MHVVCIYDRFELFTIGWDNQIFERNLKITHPKLVQSSLLMDYTINYVAYFTYILLDILDCGEI